MAGMYAAGRLPSWSHAFLIVDDSPRFLEAARGRLEHEGIMVVAVATNGADAIPRAAELGPDVILVDVDLGGRAASTSYGG